MLLPSSRYYVNKEATPKYYMLLRKLTVKIFSKVFFILYIYVAGKVQCHGKVQFDYILFGKVHFDLSISQSTLCLRGKVYFAKY